MGLTLDLCVRAGSGAGAQSRVGSDTLDALWAFPLACSAAVSTTPRADSPDVAHQLKHCFVIWMRFSLD